MAAGRVAMQPLPQAERQGGDRREPAVTPRGTGRAWLRGAAWEEGGNTRDHRVTSCRAGVCTPHPDGRCSSIPTPPRETPCNSARVLPNLLPVGSCALLILLAKSEIRAVHVWQAVENLTCQPAGRSENDFASRFSFGDTVPLAIPMYYYGGLHETCRRMLQEGKKSPAPVSYVHLNKHRLINSFEAEVYESAGFRNGAYLT
jgi:hypothetical protein